MKIWKFVVGIILFIAPIGLYATSSTVLMHAPLGTLLSDSSGTTFAVHTFSWYSDSGRIGYFTSPPNAAGNWASIYFMEIVAFIPVAMSAAGILTTIILYAIAVYIVCSIIDNEILNLIADLLMIGCTVMSMIAFFDFLNVWSIFFNTSVPIFGIIAGIAGLLGFALSIKEMRK